jgi:hypothetical protein
VPARSFAYINEFDPDDADRLIPAAAAAAHADTPTATPLRRSWRPPVSYGSAQAEDAQFR